MSTTATPKTRPPLTQSRLKELLHYDPETGHFTWCGPPRRGITVGARAGCYDRMGYRVISLRGRPYKSHRLAFLFMTGAFPSAEVDHINRVPSDNRWTNLRVATRRDNEANKGLMGNNTSGYRGVSWSRTNRKWRAYGKCGGPRIHLGYYSSLEEAAAVAQHWREENFGEFAPRD